jgi:hypothetical protein
MIVLQFNKIFFRLKFWEMESADFLTICPPTLSNSSMYFLSFEVPPYTKICTKLSIRQIAIVIKY